MLFVPVEHFLILCNYCATMEVPSSDEELIHQSTSSKMVFSKCYVTWNLEETILYGTSKMVFYAAS